MALARRLGEEWRVEYRPATVGEAGVWGPGSEAGEEGLAILARAALADVAAVELPAARPRERRILLSARLGGCQLHTTHLHWRVSDGVAREEQVVAIDAAVRARGGELHILGGDFNAPADSDEIRFLAGRCTLAGRRATWQDAWARARGSEPGLTWSRRNPMTAHLGWLEPDRRVDYLWVSLPRPDGRGQVRDARVILDGPEHGVWPSDHFAVVADVWVGDD